MAVGYDNIDVGAARRLGVAVCNTPGVLDETTADVAFLLDPGRLAPGLGRRARPARRGRGGASTSTSATTSTAPRSASSATGASGEPWPGGRRASACRSCTTPATPPACPATSPRSTNCWPSRDIVSLHVPLTDETRHLIGARELALLRPHAVRGQHRPGTGGRRGGAGRRAARRHVFAAGLDVYEREPDVNPRLLSAPRTVLLPHIGSASRATRTQMARVACQGVCDVLAGRTPANLVTV